MIGYNRHFGFMWCALPLLVILLQSCQSLPTMPGLPGSKNLQAPPPEWYLKPPANTPFDLYGKGASSSQQEAVNAALAEIAASLRVTIQSETKQRTVFSGGREAQSLDEQIQASVNAIEFSNYDIVRSDQQDGRHWVHVKVNKGTLAKDINNQIVNQKKALELEFAEFAKSSALEQSREAPVLDSKLDALKVNATTLSTLTDFDSLSIATFVTNYKNKLDRAKRDMVVRIEHDNRMGLFSRKLEELLTQRDIKVVNSGGRTGKSVLAIKSVVKQQRYGNAYVSVVDLKVQALDDRGKVLNTYVKTLNGASPSSYDAALQQANLKLFNAFVDDDVLGSAGF